VAYLVDTDILIDLSRGNAARSTSTRVAATAIHEGRKLAIQNRKHFDAIGGLEIQLPKY